METLIHLDADTLPPGVMVSPVVFGRDSFGGIDTGDIDPTLIDDDAILPDPSRRRPITPEEIARFSATADTPHPRLIECITPPDDLLQAAFECQQTDPTQRELALGRLATCGAAYNATYITYGHAPAHRLVATVYPGTDEVPALHVDDRNKLPPEFKMGGKRRSAINVGPGTRWLYVCQPDVITMSRKIGAPCVSVNNPALKAFAQKYTDEVTCIWIPIPPGTGWIGGTDMFGHDGGTYEQDESTAYFFTGCWVRGYWRSQLLPA